MNNFLGFNLLFEQANCDFVVFDLSRRVVEIPKDQFETIEKNFAPYPFPIQKKAQLAIAYWQKNQKPWIWFLQFPLDERSLLKQASIGDFIQYIAAKMGAINGELNEQEQQELANNPYIFQPQDDKKAIFHAKLTKKLNLTASSYYSDVLHYCQTQRWQEWQHLGLQGIADLCTRISEKNNPQKIINALNNMPQTAKYALLGCLEHVEITKEITQCLAEEIHHLLRIEQFDLFYLSALIRAMAGSNIKELEKIVDLLFANEKTYHQELITAISGRCWHALLDKKRLEKFLLIVISLENPLFFQKILEDLALIPNLRFVLLPLLHSEDSPKLQNAINNLQRSIRENA